MKVTNVMFRKYESGKLMGFADVELDQTITLKGVKVFQGRDGEYFAAMPSIKDEKSKSADGKSVYRDVVYVDRESDTGKAFKEAVNAAVVAAMKTPAPAKKAPVKSNDNPGEIDDADVPF